MATAEQYADWIIKNRDKAGTPEFETVSAAYKLARDPNAKYKAMQTQPYINPTEGMSAGEKFRAGTGKAFYDLGQGVAQLVGAGESPEQTRNRREADKPLMTGAGMAGNVMGNITAFAPLAMVPGANTVAGSAALGSTIGALQPGTVGEKMTGMGLGGILGGGVQALTHLPQAIQFGREAGRALAEPLTRSGQEQIVGRTLNRATGGQERQVIQNLQGSRPLIPGSEPTAGQAAQNAGIAALERTAVATQPSVMELNRQTLAAQNQARLDALRRVAGEGGAYEAAIASREGQAAKLYGAARQQGVDPQMAKVLQPQIKNLLERAPSGVVEKAKELARVNGEVMGPQGSVTGLHWMKIAVDDLISGAKQTGMGNVTKRGLVQFQKDLLSVVDDLSPAYAKARSAFAAKSAPINEMEIGRELLSRSVRPLDETLMPGKYAAALANPNLPQSATGFSGSTLQGTMSPQNLATLNAIKEDLARANFAQTAGRGAGSDTVQKMAMSNLLNTVGVQRLPTLLNRPAMLTNYALEKIYGGSDREMALLLAEALRNPQEVARLMSGVQPGLAAIPPQLQRQLGLLGRTAILPPALSNQ